MNVARRVAPRMKGILADILRSGLDPACVEPLRMRRIRTFNSSTLILILLAVPVAGLDLATGSQQSALQLTGAIAASVANLWLLRQTGNIDLSGQLGTSILFVFLLGQATISGGFYQPDFGWLYLVPVVAGMLIGVKGCMQWVALSALATLGFWLLAESGLQPPSSIPAQHKAMSGLISRLVALLGLGTLAIGFMKAQRQLEAGLRISAKEQEREAGFVRLLNETTIAANEAPTIGDALSRATALLCRSLDCSVGCVYMTSHELPMLLCPTAVRFGIEDERHSPLLAQYEGAARVESSEFPYRAFMERAPLWLADLESDGGDRRLEVASSAGLRTAIALPIDMGDNVAAVIELFSRQRIERDARVLSYLEQICVQLGYAAQRDRVSAQLRSLVFFDPLTGLPNRRHFQERLNAGVAAARARSTGIALLFLDLDGFKTVNDTLGHEAGDRLLSEVAARLSQHLREHDCIARLGDEPGSLSRLGGDEFTVLLENVPDGSAAAKVARRLLCALHEPFSICGQEIYTGVSIGISLFPTDAGNASALLRHADVAMYHAKDRGRNNFQFFTEKLGQTGERRLMLESRLCRAVEAEEFELHYQPVRHARSGRVVAAEAVLRWTDPALGVVSPAEFIPIAESSGQIAALGAWMIRNALTQAAAWTAEGLVPIRLSVNVSGCQLRQPRIVSIIRDALAHSCVSPALLELELTESTIMQDDAITTDLLLELDAMGVGIALDDFGTGWSSLSHLRRLPIRRVKLDRSFVAEIPGSADDCVLVKAVVAMAHGLHLPVVAEGVETVAQLEFLRRHACDEVQGRLFSPAVPASEFEKFLEREKPECA